MKLTITTTRMITHLLKPELMKTILFYTFIFMGLSFILVLFPNSFEPNLHDFVPTSPWEHYCKYELHKHPSNATNKEYNYFLDTFTGTDEYEQILEIYEDSML